MDVVKWPIALVLNIPVYVAGRCYILHHIGCSITTVGKVWIWRSATKVW